MKDFIKPKKWTIAKIQSDDPIVQILINRGIAQKEDQDRFLHLNFDRDFLNPFLLKDMKAAVERIKRAIKNNEKIGIFGDYDADGIPGTALLIRALKLLEYNNYFAIIPTREAGYGINESAIDEFIIQGCGLVITIDNGITAKEVISYATENKIETIIIDHHEVQPSLKPEALAIINPKQSDCQYPEKNLAACALVYKLIWALFKNLNQSTDRLKWLLDLVGISTIADLVPLVGENRLLAHYGLIVLNKTKNLGLKELAKLAGLADLSIDAYHVGFMIAPRLNAPSRMGREKSLAEHPNLIPDLLVTDDSERAKSLAKIINEVNVARQKLLEQTVEEAAKKAFKLVQENKKIIILRDKNWSTGIIGLVASRLVEKFNRPAFVFGQLNNNWVGSARSIRQFHLIENLAKHREIFIRFGGHAQAAGMTIDDKLFTKFEKTVTSIADQKLSDDDLIKEIKIDLKIKISDINLPLIKKIQKLAPFGLGNPQPIFCVTGKPVDKRLMGKDLTHLSFYLKADNEQRKVVCFGGAAIGKEIENAEEIAVVANLKINEWNNIESPQLYYIDHRIIEE